MTKTTVHNAITIGLVSARDQHPAKVSLGATTTGYMLSAQLTTGSLPSITPGGVKAYFASAPYDIAAASAPKALGRDAETLEIFGNQEPNTAFISTSQLGINQGGFFYVWLEWGKQQETCTLTTTLVEIP